MEKSGLSGFIQNTNWQKKFNIPLCILPQTIGPFNDAGLRKKAMGAVRSAKCVMVRDKQSADYVKSLLPNLDVTEIIDVAFFMPYEKKNLIKSISMSV